jgi:hypothetical protein
VHNRNLRPVLVLVNGWFVEREPRFGGGVVVL